MFNQLVESYARQKAAPYTLGQPKWNVEQHAINIATPETSIGTIFFSSDGTKLFFIGGSSDSVKYYSLSVAWDLTSATLSGTTVSVTSLENAPTGLYFKPDGLKFYVIGTTADTVFQYSMSVAWDISTASYESKSYNTTQAATPRSLSFSSDGTKMYVLDSTTDTVYQYTLSTAWDVSTASYASKSFSVTTQESSPFGMYIKDDGAKMWVIGDGYDGVSQYTLGTPWDISTASFDSKQFSTSSATLASASATSVFIGNSGNKMYCAFGGTEDVIWELNLSTPYDVTTATVYWEGQFKKLTEVSPLVLEFNSDGTKMYAMSTSDIIYQYSLSGAYNITTASYDSKSFSVATQTSTALSFKFKPDGTKLYVKGSVGIYQYSLSVAWDISTASYDSKVANTSYISASSKLIGISSDGTKFIIHGINTSCPIDDHMFTITMATPWDVSTSNPILMPYMAQDDTLAFTTATEYYFNASPDVHFSSDGTKMYIVDSGYDNVREYTLSTAWQPNTRTYSSTFSIIGQVGLAVGFTFSQDGAKMYITSSTVTYQYTLGTPWSLSTAAYDSKSYTPSEGGLQDVDISSDGTKFYFLSSTGDIVTQYNLSVAYDISTATTASKTFAFGSQDTTPRGIRFKTDGTIMYITGGTNDTIYQYTLSTAWDVSTASYASKSFDLNNSATTNFSTSTIACFDISSDGTKIIVMDTSGQSTLHISLGTAWDLATATMANSSNIALYDTIVGIYTAVLSADGKKAIANVGGALYEFNLPSAWITTSTLTRNRLYPNAFEVPPTFTGFVFNGDGSKLILTGQNNGLVGIVELGLVY